MPEKGVRSEALCTTDFVADGLSAFEREVFEPILQHAHESPAEARRLIAAVRDKLEPLDKLLAQIPNGAGASTNGALSKQGVPRDLAGKGIGGFSVSNGTGKDVHADSEVMDEIGRNQRSRLRELTLLEFMAQDTRAYSLHQLMAALAARGFTDSSAAVVSQLHRLKQNSVINQPANGMYEITDGGLGHLRQLRSSFGALLNDGL